MKNKGAMRQRLCLDEVRVVLGIEEEEAQVEG